MKNGILIFIILSLFVSCNHSEKSGLKISVGVKEKLDPKKFDVKVNPNDLFYSVDIDIMNNTDTTLTLLTLICNWQTSWITNNEKLILLDEKECVHEYINYQILKPKGKVSFSGMIRLKPLETINDKKKLKLGFVLVSKQEFENFSDFKNIIPKKIREKKDIFWSEELILK